jgi:DMSO/TMAO reductase YedYZ molybdopterin-dependent catalytic subunit
MTMTYKPTRSAHRPEGFDGRAILEPHRKEIERINRRGVLRGAVSLGAVTMLTGCDISNNSALQAVLRGISSWNDAVQAWMFDPNKLAPTYTDADVARPPRFNAFYSIHQVKPVNGNTWKLELAGKIIDKRSLTKEAIYAMPSETQITRHICVEGWDYIGKWSGVPLRWLFDKIGADKTAKYVGFKCYDGYYGSIDMATALHPQTILATHYDDKIVEDPFGFPVRLKAPTKLGFKQPKWITAMEVTDVYPGGYWEDGGYNWFSGL